MTELPFKKAAALPRLRVTIEAEAQNWDALHGLQCRIDRALDEVQDQEGAIASHMLEDGAFRFLVPGEGARAEVAIGIYTSPDPLPMQWVDENTFLIRPENDIRAGGLGDTP